mmetsp:Transcript_8577/g.12453  ORF Transcript_8577/g.12453 Transcript_8577/m.12453 type:complete len:287 (+) Transcript_8577:79-939(+)|eukprot:CAMPEP_0195508494 /NCGR_PEP_ID=MMETSP0794_2-20130614/1692_1 /TAXON_ID=515487 /ORGANISM="Stephanopyxis turris, Strain CCMP 815" /LENGTH=286 /DNA_ID=CAMNT_0040635475 /DNA_START=13 /DNA_END=873 /DNA_ORIENTATION=-
MASNDETYLESVIESISSTLPNDIRRNLELLRQLDESTADVVENLKQAEDAYVKRAQRTMLNYPLPPHVIPEGGGNDPASAAIIPTTEELQALVEDPVELARIAQLRRDARQLIDEKVAVAEQTHSVVEGLVGRLDRDIAEFETLLKGAGEFETTGAKPNDLAAIQVSTSSPDSWILAKVISHDTETGMYNLSDEDVESNKIFHLPESQVVVLGGVERLSRGDIIFAVYPDTTSFYQATVVQAPRKVQGGSSFVMVNFQDDGDEHGVTHDKAVLMKHVMRAPIDLT